MLLSNLQSLGEKDKECSKKWSYKINQEHYMPVAMLGFGCLVVCENSMLKKGHNYIKNTLMVFCPCCMGCTFWWMTTLYQSGLNIFCNITDIAKYQSFLPRRQWQDGNTWATKIPFNPFSEKSQTKKCKKNSVLQLRLQEDNKEKTLNPAPFTAINYT